MGEVKLYGKTTCPFHWRVVMALELKGVEYEFIEEDLSNKSPMLLQYNPIHKKIPVLVHDGKPVCDSSVILEYIEETWPQNPLLPSDPYERGVARLWLKFANEKVIPAMFKMIKEEEKELAIKESEETLKMVEEQYYGKKFFGGDKIGIVDIAFSAIAHYLKPIQSHIGVRIFEAEKFPLLHAWINNFIQDPVIKETLPILTKKE